MNTTIATGLDRQRHFGRGIFVERSTNRQPAGMRHANPRSAVLSEKPTKPK
jgi:hypothetical protein